MRLRVAAEDFSEAVCRGDFIMVQYTTISPGCSAEFGKGWSVFVSANLGTFNLGSPIRTQRFRKGRDLESESAHHDFHLTRPTVLGRLLSAELHWLSAAHRRCDSRLFSPAQAGPERGKIHGAKVNCCAASSREL